MARHTLYRALLAGTMLTFAPALTLAAAAEEPKTAATPAKEKPNWITTKGETRVRYETVDGQFRAGGSGGDQVLAVRSLFLAEANLYGFNLPGLTLGVEVQDSRQELDDAGTPLSTSNVNAFDALQAYVRVDLDSLFGQKDVSLTLGRQTLDIGSRRVLERVEMTNVIFSYTGAYLRSVSDKGSELHMLYVSPVGRKPTSFAELADNEIVADEEEWGRTFWGVHYRQPKALEALVPDTWVEAFLYRLKERDTSDVATPNRDYWQPGARLYRAPKKGRSDFEVEGSWRTGSRRATTSVSDLTDLDVDAWTLHAHYGWTFDTDWKWRVSVDYDFASGDKNPADGRFDRYERLFGGRRTDLGHTGIFGVLTPSNIDALGARIELEPTKRMDLRLAYKAAYLDSATDVWTDARVQDPSGQSGRFIGHSWDSRMRYWLVPGTLRGELGAAALLPGRFAKTAPNSPKPDQSLFGYAQVSLTY
jgi:hypothetical protein